MTVCIKLCRTDVISSSIILFNHTQCKQGGGCLGLVLINQTTADPVFKLKHQELDLCLDVDVDVQMHATMANLTPN